MGDRMKIGVIADTHVPERQRTLPANLKRVFAGVDIILHAGDVCSLDVLRELQNNFTITIAVSGESDAPDVKRYLEPLRVVEFSGSRIGLIHGHQAEPTAWWRRLLTISADRRAGRTQRYIRSAFQDVQCIVYGHTHRAFVGFASGVLLFNPGPAAPIGGQRPSVGVLEVEAGAVSGHIIYLDEV
jgi:putative phosphoesterase